MNTATNSADSDTESQPPLPPHQDLDRLRRSTSDRYIAGVAGGLGRHFNIDPTVIRVLLAVLTLFGGAGALIYAVCWAFVPEEGHQRAIIRIGSDARKILLLAAAAIAVVLAMGDAFSGFNAGWPIASIAIVIGVVMVARDRRDTNTAAASAVPPPVAPTSGSLEVPTPSWTAPVAAPPLLPPHPKRTGIVWFWPTLALIAIAMGIIGLIDSRSNVDVGVYPAVALAITGVMLLIGSFVGRAGGLILIGLVSSAVLIAATVLGSFDFNGQKLHATPTSSAAVDAEYSVPVGEVMLDLTKVSDPAALAGRSINLHLKAGHIDVIVPRGLDVTVRARMGFAGGITIPGYDGGGYKAHVTRHLIGSSATGTTAPLVLDINVRVGLITVEQQ